MKPSKMDAAVTEARERARRAKDEGQRVHVWGWAPTGTLAERPIDEGRSRLVAQCLEAIEAEGWQLDQSGWAYSKLTAIAGMFIFRIKA